MILDMIYLCIQSIEKGLISQSRFNRFIISSLAFAFSKWHKADKNVTMIQSHWTYSLWYNLHIYFCVTFMSLPRTSFPRTPYWNPSVHFTSFSSFYPTLCGCLPPLFVAEWELRQGNKWEAADYNDADNGRGKGRGIRNWIRKLGRLWWCVFSCICARALACMCERVRKREREERKGEGEGGRS